MSTAMEMPKYKCDKEVWALKIKEIKDIDIEECKQISFDTPVAILIPENSNYAPFVVTWDYWNKHKPQAGGYYVVYKDGYKSFSPAKAFEDGYSLIK